MVITSFPIILLSILGLWRIRLLSMRKFDNNSFLPFSGNNREAMKCANIFIVTFDDDPEVNAAKDSLKKRYGDRNIKEIVPSYPSYQDNKVPCFVPKKPESQPTSEDTGILIAHGTPRSGFLRDLLEPATRTAFVNWLLS